MSEDNFIIIEMMNQAYLMERKNQSQMSHQLKMHQQGKGRLHCRFCYWLGDKLVLLGVWLQCRFGKAEVLQDRDVFATSENSG